MKKFEDKIKNICKENKNVAMFIDMDGTITEYEVYPEELVTKNMNIGYSEYEPIECIINILKEINNIPNIDLYILTLSRNSKIVNEKKNWLRKYVNFIKEENWIFINKELGEYDKTNRNIIKAKKINEKIDQYDYAILLDDDHKILKETQKMLKNKVDVFHISSAII